MSDKALSNTGPFVVVHGGVHKTATSHLQSILQRNAGKLRKQGVQYINHRHTRMNFTNLCHENGYAKIGWADPENMPDESLHQRTREFFDKIGATAGNRIIISDENMSGHCGQCIRHGTIYRRQDALLPAFASSIHFPVREVYLAIRNYADFFASAFVEYLRSANSAKMVSEIEMKRRVLSQLPSWRTYLENVSVAFPSSKLVIWCHEDLGKLQRSIVTHITGSVIAFDDLADPKRTRVRPSASHRAVQELLDVIQTKGAEAALAQRVEIQEKYPRGDTYPGYDPWSEHERAHLTRLYEQDVAQIKTMPGIRFLEP